MSAPVQRALLFNETIDARAMNRMLDVVFDGAVAQLKGGRKPQRAR